MNPEIKITESITMELKRGDLGFLSGSAESIYTLGCQTSEPQF